MAGYVKLYLYQLEMILRNTSTLLEAWRWTMNGHKLLTVYEAADSLGLAPVTLRTWIAQRRIGVVRLGRAVRIPLSEIERLIERSTVPAREGRL
jgi:excisionase family DNA binding protein